MRIEELLGERPLLMEVTTNTFHRLKGFSIDLLDLLRSPKKVAPFLPEMADFLRRAPPDALQPCLDFTLFPLLLLLDAAVLCRSDKKVDYRVVLDFSGAARNELVISDRVSEDVLMCVEELLKKCHLVSVDQMTVVMKKLTSAASLSPSEAAEEFREGVIRCLQAMLLGLQSCSSASCSCAKFSGNPALSMEVLQFRDEIPLKKRDCLLAFLRSQDASAAVGHILSLLLQTAELEIARGQIGSGSLRKEAFFTLRILIAKVGVADALAFFLPGVVSRFAKALNESKSAITGASGHVGSIEQAIRGLTEFLSIVLNDDANLDSRDKYRNENSGFILAESSSAHDVLEVLRHLPYNAQVNQSEKLTDKPVDHLNIADSSSNITKGDPSGRRHLHVLRTKNWIDTASANVDKILSAILPNFCVHPAEKVRNALVDGIKRLLSYCCWTMKRSKFMLLECLFVLACDDLNSIADSALRSLESLFMLGDKFFTENEVSEIFRRLVEKLSRSILGCEENDALLNARKLFALMYCAGPDCVIDHLLCCPAKAASFFEMLSLSLSHRSQFAGSVDKLVSYNRLSVGYLLSIAELKAGSLSVFSEVECPRISPIEDSVSNHSSEDVDGVYPFPHMPPWFIHVGSQRLYHSLSGILSLVGLSVVKEHRREVLLSTVIDIPLLHVRNLVKEIRSVEQSKESWRIWYARSLSGQLLRQASTAVCILNEIIYGLSDQSAKMCTNFFRRSEVGAEDLNDSVYYDQSENFDRSQKNKCLWRFCPSEDARSHLIHCVGSILRDYLSPEIWNIPGHKKMSRLDYENDENVPVQFFRDVMMLHQVIIEGIGVFSITLGKEFECNGFMHSSLYLLLQNLISSSSQIKTVADAVLRVLAATSGHASVGSLVVANADYIIDSLCLELRHLDLNSHVPDVLASILSYIGAARDILPLLEEPMHAVSLELEVLGRNQHPELTAPFLKALCAITKASRSEASRLPEVAGSFHEHLNSKAFCYSVGLNSTESGEGKVEVGNAEIQIENWEEQLLKLNDMKRYRRIVGSLVASCLKVAIPLLALRVDFACLFSLDIVEDALISLLKVEDAYKIERETKLMIQRSIQSFVDDDPEDNLDFTDEDADENRLLPAINKIWPFLIICLKNKATVAVVRRCTSVMSTAVQAGGGDFFTRRFLMDGSVIWNTLKTSPFHKKPMRPKDDNRILLPYRSDPLALEEPVAESSALKIQEAALKMIAEIANNKRSASALQAVLKKAAGLVVGIAYGGPVALRDASFEALSGLSSIDPDLIWLLLADVYYSISSSKEVRRPMPKPPVSGLLAVPDLLPPASSSKEHLYRQYGGEAFGFDLDPSSVEIVFQRMQQEVLG